jgi:hypothetical protein
MKIYFATLAFGEQYRHHAKRLCQDLNVFAPNIPVLVITDKPAYFFDLENVTVEPYHPSGILRRYHDKRLLVQHTLDRQASCIVIDANSRICEPLPASIHISEGITGFITMPLEQHLREEEKDPSLKQSGRGSMKHTRHHIERAAAHLGVNLADVSFIQESIYAVRGDPERIQSFIDCWGRLGSYFDYHGMAWSEGYGIGLAAAKCGITIQQHNFIPLESFYKHRIHDTLILRGAMTHEPVLRARAEVRAMQDMRFTRLPKSLAKQIEKTRMGCRWLRMRTSKEPLLA